jgi:hypothetical protein
MTKSCVPRFLTGKHLGKSLGSKPTTGHQHPEEQTLSWTTSLLGGKTKLD